MSLRGMMPMHVGRQDLTKPHVSVRNLLYFRWLPQHIARRWLDAGLKLHRESSQHILGLCSGQAPDECLAEAQHRWGQHQRWYLVRIRGQEWTMSAFRPRFNWMRRRMPPRAQRGTVVNRLFGHRMFHQWRRQG